MGGSSSSSIAAAARATVVVTETEAAVVAAAVVVTAAVRTVEVIAVVGAAGVNIARPAAAVAKITVSAAGVAGVSVTAGAAVLTAVTAAEGTRSVDMSHDGQQANTWGVGLSPGGGITTQYLGQRSVEPVEVKATSAVWPGRASGGTLR